MIDHDAKPGPLTRCQICGSNHLRLIIDLGHQPPCDALLTAEQLNEPETTYPLRLMQCEECSLAQLDYVVPADKVYPASYPYKAGLSWPVVEAHKEMAEQLVHRFGVGLTVDIGSNDGTLAAQFAKQGCLVVGVEPTDVADAAEKHEFVVTLKQFFDERGGREMAQTWPERAHLITMTNVFAHMGDLGEVMRGVCALLASDGVLVIENHYLLDVLERNQFDTIYHEHVRTYSLKALMRLFEQYGMEVFDVERVPRYGGNIRVFVARVGTRSVSGKVGRTLALEEQFGISSAKEWGLWRDRVYKAREQLMTMLYKYRGDVVGCSAPGRASTLLNFYGITPDLLPWTGEIPGSLKIGKYIPGCHVPIVSNERIRSEQPQYLALLAWHYAAEIAERLRREGVQSQFVTPLPDFYLEEINETRRLVSA